MKNIYHFILDHRIGGPHVYVTSIRDFARRGESEIVVTTGKGPITDIALLNLRHVWWPLYILEVPFNIAQILWFVFSGKICVTDAIFHIHGVSNVAPLYAARVFGIPVLWHLHEVSTNFRWIFNIGKMALKKGRFYIAVVARRCESAYALRDSVFLPGAIDHEFWRPAMTMQMHTTELDGGLGWDASNCENPLRLLVVGNLNPTKGLDILFSALNEARRPVVLKVVGAELTTHGSYAKNLYAYAESVRSGNNDLLIEFLHWQDRVVVRELMAGCHAFVLPSRSEACPLVLLEALAMGCHCVAADVGDVRLMLAHDERHRVFQPGAVDELREILQTLEATPTLPGLHSSYVYEWSLERLVAKIESIYGELRKSSSKFT